MQGWVASTHPVPRPGSRCGRAGVGAEEGAHLPWPRTERQQRRHRDLVRRVNKDQVLRLEFEVGSFVLEVCVGIFLEFHVEDGQVHQDPVLRLAGEIG